MQKRGGLSRLAVNLLIGSLIIILGVVIFFIVRGYMNDGQEVFTDENIDLKISQVKTIDDNTLDLTLKRDLGEGEFVGLSFAVSDGSLTEVVRVNSSMPENQSGNFSLNFISLNASRVKKISVTPIYINEEGIEVIGNVKDEYITPNTCSNYCPVGAQCGFNDCGMQCGNGCDKGYLCLNYKCIKQQTSSGGSGGGGGGGSSGGETCTDTCSSLGYQCGTQSVCSKDVNCGTCNDGYTCSTNSTCIKNPQNCTDTCSTFGYNCGIRNICNISTNCGSCSSGFICNNTGLCQCNSTCSSLSYQCGTRTVCGESVNCGTCQTGYTCQTNGTCMKNCVPTTCAALSRTCGTASNGCGGTLNCGTCNTGYTCQANGTCIKDDGTLKYIVQNNVGYADIIISSSAPNTVKLAAEYFQMYVYNMTGVRLPISNSADQSKAYHVYIGRSSYTDSLGITSSGCKDGGFKMISGTNYLVLLGDDTVTDVPGITDSLGPRDYTEWDAYVRNKWGESFKWGNDFIEAYTSHYNDLANIWEGDERGSMNAVFEFLYNQGIRWYYPGWDEYEDIGTIIPEKSSIGFGSMNVLINPDASMRSFALYGYNYPGISEYHLGDRAGEVLQWVLSLRTNLFYDYIVGALAGPAHGMVAVIDRQRTTHPEYFAVYDGVRQTDPPSVNLCYPYYTSQNRLFEETVKYAKTMFDLYDVPVISIMPTDGFEGPSDECKNKATPERGYDGMYSDYVWEFVNNVAWEIYNNPQYEGKVVYNSAYGNYGAPPINLSQPLAPNLWVMFPRTDSIERYPNTEFKVEELLDMWMNTFASNNYLTGGVETNKLFTYDSYYHNVEYNPERNLPFYMPHITYNSLNLFKDTSLFMGEFMEIPTLSGEANPEYDIFLVSSLNSYITARLYWNTDQDIDAIMDEYYNLFYGPAASKMKELIEYSENNYVENRFYSTYLSTLRQKVNEALAMVPANSKYAQRITLLRDLLYQD